MTLHRWIGRGLLAAALIAVLPSLAEAQRTPLYQSGLPSPRDLLISTSNGIAERAPGLNGDVNGRGANPFSITDNNGLGLCSTSAVTTGNHSKWCLGHTAAGDAVLRLTNSGTAAGAVLDIDGTTYPMTGTVNGMPFVADNAALSALPTTNAAAITRLDFGGGFGAPPLVYTASGSACSLNAGAGDGGSQVPSSDAKCWLAKFPSSGRDVRWFGARTASSNNASVIQAAFTSLAGAGGTIFMAERYPTTDKVSYTLTEAYSRLRVHGGGGLASTSADGGLRIVINTPVAAEIGCYSASVDIDIEMVTATAGGGNALDVDAETSCVLPTPPLSTIKLYARGGSQTAYWTRAARLHKVSNVNITGMSAGRFNTPWIGGDILVEGDEPDGQYAVGINFTGFFFSKVGNGILYGDYLQGVTVNQSNFTEVQRCAIEITAGATGFREMLQVFNSQFGFNNDAYYCANDNMSETLWNGNLFLLANGVTGLNFGPFFAVGNTFVNNQCVQMQFASVAEESCVVFGAGGDLVTDGNIYKNSGTGVNVTGVDSSVKIGSADRTAVSAISTRPVLVANNGPTEFLELPAYLNPRDFGAACLGASDANDDHDGLAYMAGLVGMTRITLYPEMVCRLRSDLTLGFPVEGFGTGGISIDSGVTLTLASGAHGPATMFAGAGTVAGASIQLQLGSGFDEAFWGDEIRLPNLPAATGSGERKVCQVTATGQLKQGASCP